MNTHTKPVGKSVAVAIISFLVIVGFATPATTYAWIDANFSNIGNIYMSGYGFGNASVNPMNYSYPSYGSQSQNQGGSFGWTTGTGYAHAFDPLRDTFPSYPQQSYGGGYSNYNYPQYSSYSYPSYGGGYGYASSYPSFGPAYPTGDYDFIGTPLCQWYDYSGRTPCAYDPHQWVYDQYTGSWY